MSKESIEFQSLTENGTRTISPTNSQGERGGSPYIVPISFKGSQTNVPRRRHSIKIVFTSCFILVGILLLSWSMTSVEDSGMGSLEDGMSPISINGEVYYENYNDDGYTPRCQLLPEEEGPLPVIIMAVGRSGSSITWDTVARMTGYPNTANEITGGNTEKTIAFFDSIDPTVGSHWASEKVCEIQRRAIGKVEKGNGIVGFQWKPYRPSLRHKFGDGAFREIASHSHPSIKVIYLTRNPLDRLLSNRKHKNYQHSEEVPAHCAVGDSNCIEHHKQHQSAIVLPTGSELLKSLESGTQLDTLVSDKLANYGVKHVHVSYDNLYKSNDAEEWSRIFRFLRRGPQGPLTIEDVAANFDLAPTSSSSHKDIIANFEGNIV